MDFDFNAPTQQLSADPFAAQPQVNEKPAKKKGSKCNLEHVVVYSFFIILKSAAPILFILILSSALGDIYALPPALLVTAMDTWFTHHIAGRHMVRLRYHIYGVDGKSYFHYEFDTQQKANKCEAITFWAFIWALPFFWVMAVVLSVVMNTAKLITVSFNIGSPIFAIFQLLVDCAVIYRFMVAHGKRSAAIRTEKKEGKGASAKAPQNTEEPSVPVNANANLFAF